MYFLLDNSGVPRDFIDIQYTNNIDSM